MNHAHAPLPLPSLSSGTCCFLARNVSARSRPVHTSFRCSTPDRMSASSPSRPSPLFLLKRVGVCCRPSRDIATPLLFLAFHWASPVSDCYPIHEIRRPAADSISIRTPLRSPFVTKQIRDRVLHRYSPPPSAISFRFEFPLASSATSVYPLRLIACATSTAI